MWWLCYHWAWYFIRYVVFCQGRNIHRLCFCLGMRWCMMHLSGCWVPYRMLWIGWLHLDWCAYIARDIRLVALCVLLGLLVMLQWRWGKIRLWYQPLLHSIRSCRRLVGCIFCPHVQVVGCPVLQVCHLIVFHSVLVLARRGCIVVAWVGWDSIVLFVYAYNWASKFSHT